tara:strand:+ start:450 stop:581 length:132 start_codon:yes stop_codon:yes gene_type:complete
MDVAGDFGVVKAPILEVSERSGAERSGAERSGGIENLKKRRKK